MSNYSNSQYSESNYSDSNLPNVKEMLRHDLIATGVEALLPKHIPFDNFIQVAAIAYLKTPELSNATQDSLMMALASCAKDGLVPDGKEAHINTYNKNIGTRQNPNYVTVAEYEPMIEGILKRVHASGEVEFITADTVFPEDEFSYFVNDEGVHIYHKPDFDVQRTQNRIKLFYAVAKLKSGEVKAVVMTRSDIEKVRSSSKAKNGSAWTQWFDRMGLKSVARRLCRHLPKGSEIFRSMDRDDLDGAEIDITPQKQNLEHHQQGVDVPELMAVPQDELMNDLNNTNVNKHVNNANANDQDLQPAYSERPTVQEDYPDRDYGNHSPEQNSYRDRRDVPDDYSQDYAPDPNVDYSEYEEFMATNDNDKKQPPVQQSEQDVAPSAAYQEIENLIYKIGSTDDRQTAIERYRTAANAFHRVKIQGELTDSEIHSLNQQLTTVHDGINNS